MEQFRNRRRIVERNVSNGSLFARPGARDLSFVVKRAGTENTLQRMWWYLLTHLCCKRYHEPKITRGLASHAPRSAIFASWRRYSRWNSVGGPPKSSRQQCHAAVRHGRSILIGGL